LLYLLVTRTWWDWPLTRLTDHCPSVPLVGHMTSKVVPEMTNSMMSDPALLYSPISVSKTLI